MATKSITAATIMINASQATFRRAGFAFGREPRVIDVAQLTLDGEPITQDQLMAVVGEPRLVKKYQPREGDVSKDAEVIAGREPTSSGTESNDKGHQSGSATDSIHVDTPPSAAMGSRGNAAGTGKPVTGGVVRKKSTAKAGA